MKYLFIVIIVVLVICLIILIKKIIDTFKILAGLKPQLDSINNNIEASKQKVSKIEETKKSFHFFFSIYVIAAIIKEVFDDDSKESKATVLTKTCVKHANQLKRI